MIDVVRGVLRVRKWPKKRGPPKSASQRFWVDWFKQANLLAKYADPMTQIRAKELTAHTGMYPRDIILAAMRGRLYTWVDDNGWRWYPVAAIDDISESLDVLAQTVGSVLVRAVDRWRAPAPGNLDEVLTLKGSPAIPVWAASAGGGGITQEVVPGTPIVVDGTKTFYDIDVSAYALFNLILEDMTYSASDSILFRFSTDGGVTFKDDVADYVRAFVNQNTSGMLTRSDIEAFKDDAVSGPKGAYAFENLNLGRAFWSGFGGTTSAKAQVIGGYATFTGPITTIKIFTRLMTTMDAGTIRLVGTL